MHRMPSDFFFDYPGRLAQFSGDEREVDLFHCTHGELFGQFAMRDIIFRYYETAACFLVETVNDTGPFFSADPCQRGAVAEQCVDQSVFALARARMNGEASRFVDHDDVIVFEDYLKWNRLRLEVDFLHRWLAEINFVAASNDLPRPGRSLVEPDESVADQLLKP